MNFYNTVAKKKLYKSKKNWYTATTIAGTIAGVMLFQSAYVTQVSADATDSSVVTPAQTSTASASPDTSTNEKNVTSAEDSNISESSTDSTSNSSSKLSQ